MTNKAKIMFAEFTSRLISPGRVRFAEIWKLRLVESFLESGFPLSKRGIKRYLGQNPAGDLRSHSQRESILTQLLRPAKGLRQGGEHMDHVENKTQGGEYSDTVGRYSRWLAERELSPATIRSYVWTAKKFLSLYAVLTQTNANAYKDMLVSEGMARTTINLRINGLLSFGTFCGVKLKLRKLRVIKTLECDTVPTPEEMGIFLDRCRADNYHCFLVARCLSTTGIRVNELKEIAYSDINAGRMVLIGKGNKPRSVFFQKSFVEQVNKYVESKHTPLYERFCPKSCRGVAQLLRAYAKKASLDVRKFHPHAFRHYFAKQYLKANPSDIVGLQALLGHSSVETTSIYLRKSHDELAEDYNINVTWQ